ncbi:MAG: T9SS type A sorting domain-containing protein [Chryseobacterium sp.]|nr:T9SS type A sorting domain-containing protein [Chryseobacterium sp.]
MKKLLLSLVMLACSCMIQAQMTITVTGSTVKFSAPIPGNDWGSTPVNLYAYVDAADTTPPGAGTMQISGGFPGTMMVNGGSGPYSITVNLASFFPSGTTINNIKFIYAVTDGGSGYYQNPAGGNPGFSVNDPAHASGYTPVTVASLAVSDLQNAKKNSFVANGKLYTNQTGNLEITVYDMTGKIVKQSQVKSSNSALELNIQQKGTYIVKVSNGSQTETLKFIK